MRKLKKCALCNEPTTLELSHIVPKLAVRHLKKTSVGTIRNAENPNAIVQDSEKHYMLCGKCEDLFSKYENYFARKFFNPYLKQEMNTFDYDVNLFRFIISVSWRSTYLDILDYVESKTCDVELLEFLIENERIMKEFLLEQRQDVAGIENHIFFFNKIESIKGKTEKEICELRPHSSLHRSITSYTSSYDNLTTCGNITNMMGIVLFTLFRKPSSDKWENTLVICGNGTIAAKNQNISSFMGNDLFSIMERIKVSSDSLGDAQQEKIKQKLKNVGEKLMDSSIFKDWESDYNIQSK